MLSCLLALLALTGALPTSASAASDTTAVQFPGGPLTVYVGPRGQCQSSYVVGGGLAGNYFLGSLPVGDCGFFLAFPTSASGQPPALKGKTFGFNGNAGPFVENEYTPLAQSPVTGSGTSTDPYTETTTFAVEAESKRLATVTETTTYVNGAAQFTSTYTVKNESGSKLHFRAMYAGDLYVNGNDVGVGVFAGGPPRFIGGQNTGSGVLGGFVEVTGPGQLEWSKWQEAQWSGGFTEVSPEDNGIWHDVETSVDNPFAFNNSIEPKELDNGAGVEWDQLLSGEGLADKGEQSFSIINRTQVPSALQVVPVTQTLTQGQTETLTATAVDTGGQPYAGKQLRYTVTGANPQSGAVTLNSAGQAQVSYLGNNAGADTIQLYVDLPGSGTQTTSDPSASASVTFLPRPPTPNSSYKVQSIHANPDGTVTIVFVPTQSGTATLEVTVPTASVARNAAAARRKKCKRGQSRIKGKCRPTNTVSGKTTAAGVAGVPLKLTVKPSSKLKKALKAGRKVTLTVKLTYKSTLGGAPTVQTFHTTVKGKKRSSKHH